MGTRLNKINGLGDWMLSRLVPRAHAAAWIEGQYCTAWTRDTGCDWTCTQGTYWVCQSRNCVIGGHETRCVIQY